MDHLGPTETIMPESTDKTNMEPGPPRLVLPAAWADRVEQHRRQQRQITEPSPIIPRAPEYYAEQLAVVKEEAGARELVELARQRPLAWVGIDFEYRPGRRVFIKRHAGTDLYWDDPRSYTPLLLAVVLVETNADNAPRIYRLVVDCRSPETVAALADLFRLPLVFVGHYLKADLICLWRLALPVPDRIWDSWAAEKALLLGLHHARYHNEHPRDELEEAQAKEDAESEAELKTSLLATCSRRAVVHPFAANKELLQKSFLNHPEGVPFSHEQIAYNAADAEAAARLYPVQLQLAACQGGLNHLVEVEMPWTVTNARMIWDGVHINPQKCQKLLGACARHQETIGAELLTMGLENVNSHPQMFEFFRGLGLLDCFRVGDGYSFDEDHLEAVEERHPAIAKIRWLRKIRRLQSDKAFTGELLGADGRLHPDHRQLGAESGRNSMRHPNIGGIGRALRPLVEPEDGYEIGEVDLSQIEVGIAAAVYNNADLITMFNGRDVYTRMAKLYFAAELSPESQNLSDKAFKKLHGPLRDRMKVFTLATIYNITPFGLALRLNIAPEQAAREQARFLDLFPGLAQALREASAYGAIRGHAHLCSGLRRYRARGGAPTSWEINWMRNTPVQGSAGVVFKVAGNRLYRRYQHYGARLLLPMHDAYVFETPRKHLETVASITAEVLKSSVQESFPVLDPQVDINISHPKCWNKDGHADSLERWMQDVTSAF
jgi:DNA polymerase I